MAYNDSSEIKETVGEWEKNSRGDYIRVTNVTPTNGKAGSVDIRNMYTNDDGDIKPTTKGIRVPKGMVGDVVVAMLRCLSASEIEDVADDICEVLGIECE